MRNDATQTRKRQKKTPSQNNILECAANASICNSTQPSRKTMQNTAVGIQQPLSVHDQLTRGHEKYKECLSVSYLHLATRRTRILDAYLSVVEADGSANRCNKPPAPVFPPLPLHCKKINWIRFSRGVIRFLLVLQSAPTKERAIVGDGGEHHRPLRARTSGRV